MKPKFFTIIVLIAMLAVGSTVLAASVEPVLVDPWQSGNAEFECEQAGCEGDYAYKIDEWDEENGMDGTYPTDEGNIITISNSDGKTFDWASEYPVDCVIVKAGTGAYIYRYDGAYNDTGLVAPEGKDISHVTFCYSEPEEECWEGETAWAAGQRYVDQGNWATYSPYVAESAVIIYAGQTRPVGEVYFSAVVDGEVTISITLYADARLELDEDGFVVEEAVKIQGYDEAPEGNPAPGQFTTYKGTDLVATVDAYNFYGIHLNVEVRCE